MNTAEDRLITVVGAIALLVYCGCATPARPPGKETPSDFPSLEEADRRSPSSNTLGTYVYQGHDYVGCCFASPYAWATHSGACRNPSHCQQTTQQR